MEPAPKISGVRVQKLYLELDSTLDEFLQKYQKTTNEEVHLALHRLYQIRELQPIISLVKAWEMDKKSEGKADYIR